MNDRWLNYADAAKALGMTPESVRQRARREGWRRQIGNDGRALVLVPVDTARNTAGDAAVSRPVIRPERDTAMLRARLQEIESRAAELRSDIERERAERLQERDRADRLAGEVADLARQLAKLTEEAGSRERDLQARLTAAQAEHVAEVLSLRDQLAKTEYDRDRVAAEAEKARAEAELARADLAALRARPWWRRAWGQPRY
jgi:hypothetical protein